MYIGVAIWSAILGGGSYFAWRFVRPFERRGHSEAALAALAQRIAALAESMNSVREDVERLDAGQEFTTRLLTPRSGRSERFDEL